MCERNFLPTWRGFIVIFCSFITLSSAAKAQQVERTTQVAGTNLNDGIDLFAQSFTFDERIENAFYDSERQLISVFLRKLNPYGYLRNKGEVLVYDLHEDKTQWKKRVKYYQNNIFQPQGYLLENRGQNTTAINIGTGKRAWRMPHELFFLSEYHGLAIGYDARQGGNLTQLEGIDISTGKMKWRRSVPRGKGWSELQQLNDSMYLIVSSGLHLLDVKTGAGWSYLARTEDKRAGNIVSNVLGDQDEFYMASKSKVVRINGQDGKVSWSSSHPEELGSSSMVFANDTALFMVNSGLASGFFGPTRRGEPFIAAYNKQSGHPYYFVQVEEPKAPIFDQVETESSLLVLRSKRIEAYSKENGKREALHDYADSEYGQPIQFLESSVVYTKKPDGTFASLFAQDSLSTFVLLNSGMIQALNSACAKMYMIDVDALWLYLDEADESTLVSDGERTLILNPQGKVQAELIAKGGMLYPDRKFIHVSGEQCYIIDLSGFPFASKQAKE